jgi:chorismate dehydratase
VLFGSISYLNLLPFQLFLKRYLRSNAAQMAFRYKRAVPSRINASLRRGEVNAAFISSVHSPRFTCTDLGIIARGAVYSVFVLPETDADDPASETSNRLARILGLHGRVLIGDAALRHYLDGGEGIDLAAEWHARTGLPFVFARLCYNRHGSTVRTLSKRFARTRIRIPHYILKREAAKRGITPAQLTWYLEHIDYTIDWRTERGLRRFLASKPPSDTIRSLSHRGTA